MSAEPAKKLAVLACMDARLNPYELLGLEVGDAHIVRNAGGLVTDDAIRSLALSQHLLGTEEIVVIQHTRCGVHGLDDEEFRARLREQSGEEPRWEPGGFADLEESVREGVERIRSSPFVPRTERVRGFIYDVETGELREVR